EETSMGGARVITINGQGEACAIWAARRHVVKIGGRDVTSVPESLVEAYAERYPSRLPSGLLDGPLPDDPPPPGNKEQVHDEDGAGDSSPSPDWDQYQPGDLEKSSGADSE